MPEERSSEIDTGGVVDRGRDRTAEPVRGDGLNAALACHVASKLWREKTAVGWRWFRLRWHGVRAVYGS